MASVYDLNLLNESFVDISNTTITAGGDKLSNSTDNIALNMSVNDTDVVSKESVRVEIIGDTFSHLDVSYSVEDPLVNDTIIGEYFPITFSIFDASGNLRSENEKTIPLKIYSTVNTNIFSTLLVEVNDPALNEDLNLNGTPLSENWKLLANADVNFDSEFNNLVQTNLINDEIISSFENNYNITIEIDGTTYPQFNDADITSNFFSAPVSVSISADNIPKDNIIADTFLVSEYINNATIAEYNLTITVQSNDSTNTETYSRTVVLYVVPNPITITFDNLAEDILEGLVGLRYNINNKITYNTDGTTKEVTKIDIKKWLNSNYKFNYSILNNEITSQTDTNLTLSEVITAVNNKKYEDNTDHLSVSLIPNNSFNLLNFNIDDRELTAGFNLVLPKSNNFKIQSDIVTAVDDVNGRNAKTQDLDIIIVEETSDFNSGEYIRIKPIFASPDDTRYTIDDSSYTIVTADLGYSSLDTDVDTSYVVKTATHEILILKAGHAVYLMNVIYTCNHNHQYKKTIKIDVVNNTAVVVNEQSATYKLKINYDNAEKLYKIPSLDTIFADILFTYNDVEENITFDITNDTFQNNVITRVEYAISGDFYDNSDNLQNVDIVLEFGDTSKINTSTYGNVKQEIDNSLVELLTDRVGEYDNMTYNKLLQGMTGKLTINMDLVILNSNISDSNTRQNHTLTFANVISDLTQIDQPLPVDISDTYPENVSYNRDFKNTDLVDNDLVDILYPAPSTWYEKFIDTFNDYKVVFGGENAEVTYDLTKQSNSVDGSYTLVYDVSFDTFNGTITVSASHNGSSVLVDNESNTFVHNFEMVTLSEQSELTTNGASATLAPIDVTVTYNINNISDVNGLDYSNDTGEQTYTFNFNKEVIAEPEINIITEHNPNYLVKYYDETRLGEQNAEDLLETSVDGQTGTGFYELVNNSKIVFVETFRNNTTNDITETIAIDNVNFLVTHSLIYTNTVGQQVNVNKSYNINSTEAIEPVFTLDGINDEILLDHGDNFNLADYVSYVLGTSTVTKWSDTITDPSNTVQLLYDDITTITATYYDSENNLENTTNLIKENVNKNLKSALIDISIRARTYTLTFNLSVTNEYETTAPTNTFNGKRTKETSFDVVVKHNYDSTTITNSTVSAIREEITNSSKYPHFSTFGFDASSNTYFTASYDLAGESYILDDQKNNFKENFITFIKNNLISEYFYYETPNVQPEYDITVTRIQYVENFAGGNQVPTDDNVPRQFIGNDLSLNNAIDFIMEINGPKLFTFKINTTNNKIDPEITNTDDSIEYTLEFLNSTEKPVLNFEIWNDKSYYFNVNDTVSPASATNFGRVVGTLADKLDFTVNISGTKYDNYYNLNKDATVRVNGTIVNDSYDITTEHLMTTTTSEGVTTRILYIYDSNGVIFNGIDTTVPGKYDITIIPVKQEGTLQQNDLPAPITLSIYIIDANKPEVAIKQLGNDYDLQIQNLIIKRIGDTADLYDTDADGKPLAKIVDHYGLTFTPSQDISGYTIINSVMKINSTTGSVVTLHNAFNNATNVVIDGDNQNSTSELRLDLDNSETLLLAGELTSLSIDPSTLTGYRVIVEYVAVLPEGDTVQYSQPKHIIYDFDSNTNNDTNYTITVNDIAQATEQDIQNGNVLLPSYRTTQNVNFRFM
jgi:hypothetical protein